MTGGPVVGKRSRTSHAIASPATDDLKLIKGIGLAVERRLREAGIHSYAQLATLSADQIAAKIGGLSAVRISHENWIGQARERAGLLANTAESKESTGRTQSRRRKSAALGAARQHYATFTVQLALDESGNVQRAVCTHHQSKDQETWNKNDWDETKLMNYVVRKAGLRPLPSPAAPPRAQPEATVPTDLISQPILPYTPESAAVPVEAQVSTAPIETTTLPGPEIRAAASAESFAAKIMRVEAENARPAGMGKAESRETVRLSGLITIPANLDHSARLFSSGTPFRVQLTVDSTGVKGLPDVPLDLVTNIYVKRLGSGSRQLIGQARDVAKLTDAAKVQIDCTGLSPGDYRIEAEVSLTWRSGGPQSSLVHQVALMSGHIHIY